MKRFICVLASALMLSSCGQASAALENKRSVPLARSSPVPVETVTREEAYETMRAVWISYIDLASILTGDEADFRSGFLVMCENCKRTGLNTLFVHVRAFGDAFYRSELFPPSYLVPKDQNGDILFDPLEIMTDTAHSCGLELHAWINPLRLQTGEELKALSRDYKTARWYADGSGRVDAAEGGSHLWLDPSHEDVRCLIAEGAAEICKAYDVDGIHYDDYFYPTTDEAFDAESFALQEEYSSLDEYRLDCVSEMCADIYEAVKAVDKDIKVGISPQGNIENNYNYLFADVKRWLCEDGYCDYLVPQIYYGYENSVKPYLETLREWREIDKDKPLIIGLAAYKVGTEDDFSYDTGILSKQAEDALDNGCQGYALYNYISLFDGSQRMGDETRLLSQL